MDQNPSLFSLSLDLTLKEHLAEAAKWARFLAVVGLVSLGFLVLAGIAFSVTLSRANRFGNSGFSSTAYGVGYSTGMALFYLVIAIIYLFPLLYLLRFANAAKRALAANDQERLIESFQNLKRFLRYIGILTIIGLAFLILSVVIGIGGVALMSR